MTEGSLAFYQTSCVGSLREGRSSLSVNTYCHQFPSQRGHYPNVIREGASSERPEVKPGEGRAEGTKISSDLFSHCRPGPGSASIHPPSPTALRLPALLRFLYRFVCCFLEPTFPSCFCSFSRLTLGQRTNSLKSPPWIKAEALM